MIRNVLGAVIALAGAAAAVLSPFRDWYDGRPGRHYRLGAVVTVVGVLLRSRALVALAGVVVLGFAVLWMVRVFQVTDSLAVAGDGSGLGLGVALALGGGVLILAGAGVMSGRRRRREPEFGAPGSADPDTWPPTREPGPSVQTSPWPEPEGDDPYVGPHPDSPGPPGTRPPGGPSSPSGD